MNIYTIFIEEYVQDRIIESQMNQMKRVKEKKNRGQRCYAEVPEQISLAFRKDPGRFTY